MNGNENRKYADNTYSNDNPMEADNPPIESYADQFANQDADMDYPPDEDHESHEDHEDEGGKGLLIPQREFERLRRGAERVQRPLSFLKCSKGGIFTLNDVDVTGARFLAIPDYTIILQKLWINGQVKERRPHLWRNGLPPRPTTFTNKERWAEYDIKYRSNPWRNSYVLPLRHESSNGIVTLESSSEPVKFAMMRLIENFNNRRRPFVEVVCEADPDSKDPQATRPELKIVGYAETNDDFSFLAEMLLVADPPFPEPPVAKWDDSGLL